MKSVSFCGSERGWKGRRRWLQFVHFHVLSFIEMIAAQLEQQQRALRQQQEDIKRQQELVTLQRKELLVKQQESAEQSTAKDITLEGREDK